jgi:hypothetical protein
MSEPTTKRKAVTFSDGLPLGRDASFTHDDELWIAYPARKNARIVAVLDRLLGIYSTMTANVVRSLNEHPENAGVHTLATSILGSVDRARATYTDIASEKSKAVTS